MISREDALQLDAADPLAALRDRFDLPAGVIYLDGNSLGALPRHVAGRLHDAITQEWGQGLIRSWNEAGWSDLPKRVGDRIGRLIGAEPDSVIACDTTSINLFKVASAAALKSDRPIILTDEGNFPTDVYVLDAVARQHEKEVKMWDPLNDEIGSDVAFVAMTEVNYRTGERHDMAGITNRAHVAGAEIIWDLAHSAGAFPVRLAECGVDYAVGCGYKYLNGGPGASAFVYVSPDRQADFANPITGWWGHARPFDMSLTFEPHEGIDRARIGTQHVLSLAGLDAALDVFDGIDLADLRAKSLSLTGLFIELLSDQVPSAEVVTPTDSNRRGSQVSFRHPSAYAVVRALIDRQVIGDFRNPDIARFGVAPLYVRHVDIWDAVGHLVEVLATNEWQHAKYQDRAAVT
ncbi:MAG: kynureninase [Acidimicrobiia bacterium]|nr:kynureninase [Acidimicrobiia bacterium]